MTRAKATIEDKLDADRPVRPGAAAPLRNLDLEAFRTRHFLTISEACECLGLQRANWSARLQKGRREERLDDHAVCALLEFYRRHPETIPIMRIKSVRDYAEALTLDPDSPHDKMILSVAHGTEKASAYRWVHGGRPSASVERLMAAVTRLDAASGRKRLVELKDVVREVAARQGLGDPLEAGTWRRAESPRAGDLDD